MSFVCNACERHFTSKQSLIRHGKQHRTDKVSYDCHLCQKSYSRKRYFDEHCEKAHGGESNFECAYCTKKFFKRKTLVDHIRVSHCTDFYVCSQCGKQFSAKKSLIRHGKQHRADKVFYECHLCQKKYTRKRYFSKHQKLAHGEITHFECASCGKIFSARRQFTRHIRLSHNAQFYECYYCSRNFQVKTNLITHVRSCRSNPSNQKFRSTINRYTCGICNQVFDSKVLINKHYQNAHEITLETITVILKSFEEFNTWKSSVQHEAVVQFIKQRSKASRSFRHENYVCHRSSINRTNRPKKSNNFPKPNGSKKLHVFCPAEMDVYISKTDGTYTIRYISTHIGHLTNDSSELRYVNLTEQEQLNIATRLKNNVPKSEIQDLVLPLQSNIYNSGLSVPLSFDARHDAENFFIDELTNESDDIVVSTFVENNKESVLYYKEQSMEDFQFGILRKEDFVIVLMNKNQEKYLRRYAKDIVCFDRTHDTDKYGFWLHTLLVLDTDGVGYPAAFVITNRDDQAIIDIFLQCLRERVGNIESNVIMTNMQNMYYNSWMSVMDAPPVYHLYCTRYVNAAWRRKFPKKNKTPMVEEVKRQLHSLRQELNPVHFEEKLENFLANDSEDAEEFITYFRRYFLQNTHCWAYAYRQYTGINTNMVMEPFHKKLKQRLTNGQNINYLSLTLRLMKEYLEMRDRKDEIKKIHGCNSSKLGALRSAHHKAENHCKERNFDGLIEIDDNTYYVQSFTDNELTFIVNKKDGSKECTRYNDGICGLPCQLCGICFHEYQCSCVDMAVCSVMCEHIHTVGIYKQKHESQADVSSKLYPVTVFHPNISQKKRIEESNRAQL